MKKFHIVVNFFSILITVASFAQTKKSICEEWKRTNDTIRNIDNQIRYNNEIINKVDLKCKVDIIIDNGYAYHQKRNIDSALANYNRAIKLGETLNVPYQILPAKIRKAHIFVEKYNEKDSNTLLKDARVLLSKKPDNKYWYYFYETQAYSSDINVEYEDAIAYMDSAIVLSKRINDLELLQAGYADKSTYLLRVSDYENAASNLLEAVKIAEQRGQVNGTESYYHMLGFCYNRWGQYETALKYYKKTLELSKKVGNDFITMFTYVRMAYPQIALNLMDEAIITTDSSVAKTLAFKDYGFIGNAYNTKGSIYFKIKNYDKAEKYYKKSYDYAIKANASKKSDTQLKTTAIQGMINIYLYKKDFKKAKKFLDLLKIESEKSGTLMYIRESNKLHSQYYETIGKPSKAIKYLREEYKIKDSISNDKVKTQVAKLEKQYNTASKELQIVKLDKEKVEQQQLATKAKAKQNLYLVASIILLSLLILGYWLFRKLKKQKEELASTNKVKNKLFSIIAHDIRGMIIPFQRSGRILQHYIEDKNYDKTITFSQELQKNSNGLSTMLDNLLSWSVEQMNGYKMNPELLYVGSEINEIVSNFSQQAEFKNANINITNTEEVALSIDKGAFHIIFRNLIGNALKYTENGTIKIDFIRELNNLKCSVIDTGIGMDYQQVENIFSLENNASTVGTKGEKGTGLGLGLVYRFVKMNDGDISVSSEKRVGTKFDITFPLSKNDMIETERMNRKEQSA